MNRGTRRRRATWLPLFGLVAFASPAKAQTSTLEVWNQLQNAFSNARQDQFKQLHYLIGYLNGGSTPSVNWPVSLNAGSEYLIVGVCDYDCTDVDLVLEDVDRNAMVSDTGADDIPMLRFRPKTSGTYWIEPTMVRCADEPCGYGIGVFIR